MKALKSVCPLKVWRPSSGSAQPLSPATVLTDDDEDPPSCEKDCSAARLVSTLFSDAMLAAPAEQRAY